MDKQVTIEYRGIAGDLAVGDAVTVESIGAGVLRCGKNPVTPSRTLQSHQGESLTIDYDPASDVITIAGVRFAAGMFRELGFGPTGKPIMIERIDDGVLTVFTFELNDEGIAAAREKQLAVAKPAQEGGG